jgi:hypothetical protein
MDDKIWTIVEHEFSLAKTGDFIVFPNYGFFCVDLRSSASQ